MIKALKILLLFASIISLLSSCNSKKEKNSRTPNSKPKVEVEAMILKNQKLKNETSFAGSIKSYDYVDLKSEIAGRVTYINLPEGSPVRKGVLLVKLYDDDLMANLKKLETQLSIQKNIFERQSKLMNVNGISKNEYDQSQLQINSIQSDIDIQKALIRMTEIRAPFDGVIGLRNISVGDHLSTDKVISTIRSTSNLKLDFNVSENYADMIKTGMNITFNLNNNKKSFKAKIVASEKGIDQDTRNLKVRALVTDRDPSLIDGSFATVNINFGSNGSAILIPSQSIIPNAAKKTVMICKNKVCKKIDIKTGIRNESEVEVIDGLSLEDTLIVSGLMFIKENDTLHFSTIKTQK